MFPIDPMNPKKLNRLEQYFRDMTTDGLLVTIRGGPGQFATPETWSIVQKECRARHISQQKLDQLVESGAATREQQIRELSMKPIPKNWLDRGNNRMVARIYFGPLYALFRIGEWMFKRLQAQAPNWPGASNSKERDSADQSD